LQGKKAKRSDISGLTPGIEIVKSRFTGTIHKSQYLQTNFSGFSKGSLQTHMIKNSSFIIEAELFQAHFNFF
jgi:hypothetical protein